MLSFVTSNMKEKEKKQLTAHEGVCGRAKEYTESESPRVSLALASFVNLPKNSPLCESNPSEVFIEFLSCKAGILILYIYYLIVTDLLSALYVPSTMFCPGMQECLSIQARTERLFNLSIEGCCS